MPAGPLRATSGPAAPGEDHHTRILPDLRATFERRGLRRAPGRAEGALAVEDALGVVLVVRG